MRNWILAAAAPMVLLVGSLASAAEFRDDARLFKPDVAAQAEKSLLAIERSTKVPIDIETVASVGDEAIADVAKRRAAKTGDRGVFVLISKAEKKIDVVVSKEYANVFPHDRRIAIHDILKKAFDRPGGPNANLVAGIEEIGSIASDAMATTGGPTRRASAPPANRRAEVPPVAPRPGIPQRAGAGGGMLGGLIVLGGIILVVLIVVRILGSLFRGATGGYGNQQMGGPGYGPGAGPGGPGYGPGPGYGGGGYGGNRGGGFMSSLFGGIGGAMAGNWIYDQMSGRNRGYEAPHETTSGNVGEGGYYGGTAPADPAGGDWVGGESTTWGDNSGGGGGDAGGDWGGGDVAGGDWGGGGGGNDDAGGWS